MSLEDFWMNVRGGARFVSSRHIVDVPKLDAGQIEAGLRADPSWLTSRRVAGYNEADFDFLSPTDRQRLTRLVRELEPITWALPLVKAPAPEQFEAALPLFRDLIELLTFDRYGDGEAFRLGKLIEARIAAERPPELAELRFQARPDWAGDPGLYIWAILTDDPTADPMVVRKETEPIDALLFAAAREIVPERYPYISFRTQAEQAELLAEHSS